MTMLNGSGGRERRILLKLAMHIVFQEGITNVKDMEPIVQQLEKLETITCFQVHKYHVKHNTT